MDKNEVLPFYPVEGNPLTWETLFNSFSKLLTESHIWNDIHSFSTYFYTTLVFQMICEFPPSFKNVIMQILQHKLLTHYAWLRNKCKWENSSSAISVIMIFLLCLFQVNDHFRAIVAIFVNKFFHVFFQVSDHSRVIGRAVANALLGRTSWRVTRGLTRERRISYVPSVINVSWDLTIWGEKKIFTISADYTISTFFLFQ